MNEKNLGWRKSSEFRFRLGKLIYERRVARKLSQEDLLRESGVIPDSKRGKTSSLSCLESGATHHLSIGKLLQIGEYLDIHPRVVVALFLIDHKNAGRYNLKKIPTRFGKLVFFLTLLKHEKFARLPRSKKKDILTVCYRGTVPTDRAIDKLSNFFGVSSDSLYNLANKDRLKRLRKIEMRRLSLNNEKFNYITEKHLILLTQRERDIVTMRKNGFTLQKCADHFLLTRERIRQIENKILEKINARS